MSKRRHSNYTSFGIKNFYKSYKEDMKSKNRSYISYKEYTNYFKEFTKILRDKLLESETIILPHRLGSLQITKFERKFNKLRSVDWKKTKENGFRVYHEDPYSYKLCWDKRRCIVKNKNIYSFKPCRTIERLSTIKIKKEKKDYYFRTS